MSKAATLPDTDLPGAIARARYVRITPMKARRVIDLIRGMSADQALATLQFAPQSAGEQVRKVVASAVANAENNDRLDRDDLIVTEAYVDEGPTLKRFRPRAQGRAYRIRKRTCHITVVVTAQPKQDKPTKKSTVAKLARRATKSSPTKASKAAAAKADTAKVSTSKESPAKASPAKATASKTTKVDTTKADTTKADTKADTTKADTKADTTKAHSEAAKASDETSAPDKDASGTAKRRAR